MQKPEKKFNSTMWGDIGIEIKYNRKKPASKKETSHIIKDVKKVGNHFRRGYVLWLNWGGKIFRKPK